MGGQETEEVEYDINRRVQREVAEYAANAREQKASLVAFTDVTSRDIAGHPSRIIAEFELFHGGTFEKELPVSRVDRKARDKISLEELLEEEDLHDLEDIEWAMPFEVVVTPQKTDWGLPSRPENTTSQRSSSSRTKSDTTDSSESARTGSRSSSRAFGDAKRLRKRAVYGLMIPVQVYVAESVVMPLFVDPLLVDVPSAEAAEFVQVLDMVMGLMHTISAVGIFFGFVMLVMSFVTVSTGSK